MPDAIASQFPALNQTINDYPLCYLDTAASAQKPGSVIDAMARFYSGPYANVHRSAHQLSTLATTEFEQVRTKLANLIGASLSKEIIFTSGTTHSINTLAYGLTPQVTSGDVILIDSAAHHANIVPWQELAKRTQAKIIPIPLTADWRLDIDAYKALLNTHPVKLVALNHVSNVLGTVNDIKLLSHYAHQHDALVAVDGAQAIAHMPVNVQSLDCDFYAFSGHKMYGPTGVGVLWGRLSLLDKLSPMMTGGEMIEQVTFEQTQFTALPYRLEAGTPAIAQVIGLGAAVDFLQQLTEADFAKEQSVFELLQQQLAIIPEVETYAAEVNNKAVIGFNVTGQHFQDIAMLLDQQGVAIRSGHHCAHPLLALMQLKGCCRVSVGIYTSKKDVERFVRALKKSIDMLL